MAVTLKDHLQAHRKYVNMMIKKKKTDDDFESILLYEILMDIVNETTAGFPAVHHPRQAEPLLLLLFLFLFLLLLS